MINLLLVWMSLPAMAQNVVNSSAILEKITPISAAFAPSYSIRGKFILPASPRPTRIQNRLVNNVGQPLITDALWDALQPPDSSIQTWLSSRVPGIDISQVRMAPFPAIDSVTRAAVAAKDNSLTFMTDDGFRTPHIYYFSAAVCQELFSKYDFNAITVESGIITNGSSFQIQGMLLGDNKVQVLYNWDNFEFSNPRLSRYNFIFRSLVTYFITGRGKVNVSGVKVDAGFVHPVLRDIQDIGNVFYQVDTDHGQQFVKSTPIMAISAMRR